MDKKDFLLTIRIKENEAQRLQKVKLQIIIKFTTIILVNKLEQVIELRI